MERYHYHPQEIHQEILICLFFYRWLCDAWFIWNKKGTSRCQPHIHIHANLAGNQDKKLEWMMGWWLGSCRSFLFIPLFNANEISHFNVGLKSIKDLNIAAKWMLTNSGIKHAWNMQQMIDYELLMLPPLIKQMVCSWSIKLMIYFLLFVKDNFSDDIAICLMHKWSHVWSHLNGRSSHKACNNQKHFTLFLFWQNRWEILKI